jgi:hypothetical protein
MTMARAVQGVAGAALFATGALLAGCANSVKFAADTAIDERGNVFRATTFSSSGTESFDDLMTRYDLLPGGVLAESFEERPRFNSAERYRIYQRNYRLERELARGDPIVRDFRRRGVTNGKAAENAISVRKASIWFVDWYSYEETFADTVSVESFAEGVRDLYTIVVDALAELISRLPSGPAANAASDRLKARFDTRVENLLTHVRDTCFAGAMSAEECGESIEGSPEFSSLLNLETTSETLLTELVGLFPAPEGVAADEWTALVDREVVYAAMQRFGEPEDSLLAARLEEQLFGVHGFVFLVEYPFALSLRLPGEVLSSNADAEESGVLRWEFDSGKFMLARQELHARSRLVHGDRIVVAGILVALVILAGIFAVVQRRSRRPD